VAGTSRKRRGAAGHITRAEYARRIGVSAQYVSKLVKQGKIPLEADGKVDPVKADAARKALRHPERDSYRKSVFPEHPVTIEDAKAFQTARTVQAGYKAKLTQLEYEMAAGRVVDKAEVKSTVFVAGRTARDALLAIPKRMAALLAAETDRAKVELMLRRELMQALTSLADEELAAQFGGAIET